MTYKERVEVRKDQKILESLIDKYGQSDVIQYITEGRFADIMRSAGEKIKTAFRSIMNWASGVVKAFKNGDVPDSVAIVLSEEEAAEAGVSPDFALGLEAIDESIADDVKECNDFWTNYMNKANVSESYMRRLDRKWKKLNEGSIPDADFVKLQADEETHLTNIGTKQLEQFLFNYVNNRLQFRDNSADNSAPLIWGAPGIGKTAIVKSVVKKIYAARKEKISVISQTLKTMDSDDFFLPITEEMKAKEREAGHKIAKRVPMEWLPVYELTGDEERDLFGNDAANRKKRTTGGILFLDELSRARRGCMDVLMKLVDEREINDYRLGDRWCIIAAANREADMADTSEFSWEPAYGRRFTQYNFVPTYKEWKEWAVDNGIRKEIIAFLDAYPNHWYEAIRSDGAYAVGFTPATWSKLSTSFDELEGVNRNPDGTYSVNPTVNDEWKRLSDDEKLNRQIDAMKGKGGEKIRKGNKLAAEEDYNNYMQVYRYFSKDDAVHIWEGTAGPNHDNTSVLTSNPEEEADMKSKLPIIASTISRALFEMRPRAGVEGESGLPTPAEYEAFLKFLCFNFSTDSIQMQVYNNVLDAYNNRDGYHKPMDFFPGRMPKYESILQKYTKEYGFGTKNKQERRNRNIKNKNANVSEVWESAKFTDINFEKSPRGMKLYEFHSAGPAGKAR